MTEEDKENDSPFCRGAKREKEKWITSDTERGGKEGGSECVCVFKCNGN